ncbi:MAG: hypothetical protein V1863_00710 [Candidatus Omnitrophota bacterium]
MIKGVLTVEQLGRALEEQKKTKEFLCTTIIRLGFATEDQVFPVLAKKLDIDYVKLKDLESASQAALQSVPEKFALSYKLFPIKIEGHCLTVAMADPLNKDVFGLLRQVLGAGMDLKIVLASEVDILAAIAQHYEGVSPKKSQMVSGEAENIFDDPLIKKIINYVFGLGIERDAVDIHTVPTEGEIKIRFKVGKHFYEIAFHKNKIF